MTHKLEFEHNSAMVLDSVIEKLLKVKLGYGEFVVEFVSKFLRHHKLLREKSDVREIQPLFGWLLLQKQEITDSAEIEVAPGVFVKPTADPLLEAYANALFNLMEQLRKSNPTLTPVILAAVDVQRYSQEVFMRMTAGAQIMAVMYSMKFSSSKDLNTQIKSGKGSLFDSVGNILKKVGIVPLQYQLTSWGTWQIRYVYALDKVREKVVAEQKPFAIYTDFMTEMAKDTTTSIDNLARVKSDVDGDDDSVVIDVKW